MRAREGAFGSQRDALSSRSADSNRGPSEEGAISHGRNIRRDGRSNAGMRSHVPPLLLCAALPLVGCGDAPGRDLWADDADGDGTGFVLLDEGAREEGLVLHISGFCVPRSAELAEPVEATQTADLLAPGEDERTVAFVPLHVPPSRILVVHRLDDRDDVRELDPDRALVRATHGRAVAELATGVYAESVATLLDGSPDPGLSRTYALRGQAVWTNLAAAELPEGIASIHPVPLGSEDDTSDELDVDIDDDLAEPEDTP